MTANNSKQFTSLRVRTLMHDIPELRRCLYSSCDSSEVYNHIRSCEQFNRIKTIMELTPIQETNITCIPSDFLFDNCKIIDKTDHWSLLLYKESVAIRRLKPDLKVFMQRKIRHCDYGFIGKIL